MRWRAGADRELHSGCQCDPDPCRRGDSASRITDTDGDQIISNEVYRPGPDKRALPATQLRTNTLDRLVEVGFDPTVLDKDWW